MPAGFQSAFVYAAARTHTTLVHHQIKHKRKIRACERHSVAAACVDLLHLSDSLTQSVRFTHAICPIHSRRFAKPHANRHFAIEAIKKKFADCEIGILKEGEITGEEIDEKQYIDQHYYAIASKATILKPAALNIPTDKFKAQFGEEWSDVLAKGRALNALDTKAKLGISADELDAKWGAAKKAGKLIKFGGGFYCGYLQDYDMYTFNAFFMTMRGNFTAPGTSIHYFVVVFDAAKLSWADFRGKVLGPTDPAEAPAESLRGSMYKDWKALGLSSTPNTGDNCVHASASPFEGFAERTNWLKGAYSFASDPFGKMMLDAGIPEATLKAWSVDPQVVIPGADGKKGSLFDQVEDMDVYECLAKLVEIYKAQPAEVS